MSWHHILRVPDKSSLGALMMQLAMLSKAALDRHGGCRLHGGFGDPLDWASP